MTSQSLADLTELGRFEVGELIELRGVGFRVRSISEKEIVLEQADLQYEIAKWYAFGEALTDRILANYKEKEGH